MPKIDNVGYGDCTGIKMEHFPRIVAMHLAVTQAVLNKNSYFRQHYRYIDLTAGKGFSPNGDKGSPIVFLDQAESTKFQIPYRADFIEQESKNINELKEAINREKKKNGWVARDIHFHNNTYQIEIPILLSEKNDKEFGLVFVDPSGELPDFDCLRYIAKMRPRMEILIYLSSTNVKRTIQYTGKRLSDYIGNIEKSHWLIRKAISWDQFKWTFLLGSNASLFKDYKSINFYQLESQDGQTILEKLDFTKKERVEAKQYKMDI
ncbi:MAG: hypothetical protein DRI56_12335 [Chloroflexota bacterium]|nr:MAG: hypothetical protein B6243_10895 [Anaerolineaceae bacterium 4572_5.2]RLD03516.1 MAG: hypothetical protein DRI56_12335 [Chloroflexota bacterium]